MTENEIWRDPVSWETNSPQSRFGLRFPGRPRRPGEAGVPFTLQLRHFL